MILLVCSRCHKARPESEFIKVSEGVTSAIPTGWDPALTLWRHKRCGQQVYIVDRKTETAAKR